MNSPYPPVGYPPARKPRKEIVREVLVAFGIAAAVLLVMVGLAAVAVFVLFIIAMNNYGSNK